MKTFLQQFHAKSVYPVFSLHFRGGIAVKALFACLIALFTVTALPVSAAAEEVTVSEANIRLELPEGWRSVNGKALTDVNKFTGLKDVYIPEDLSFISCREAGESGKRTISLFVAAAEDDLSRKIKNNDGADYSLISSYTKHPDKHFYMQNRGGSVISASEKIQGENCTFYITEYTAEGGEGICASTVVNGRYISLDFRKLKESFSDPERLDILNAVRTAAAIEIDEEEPLLDTRQIVLLGGLAFLLIALVVGIIVKRKKSSY